MVTHKNHDLGIVGGVAGWIHANKLGSQPQEAVLGSRHIYSLQNMPKSHASRIPIFGWDLTNFYLLWGLLSATPKKKKTSPKPSCWKKK